MRHPNSMKLRPVGHPASALDNGTLYVTIRLYRIHFGKEGERLVILVGGGTKKRQREDIKTALARWQDYKQRKEAGG
jgi:hypothetical protein